MRLNPIFFYPYVLFLCLFFVLPAVCHGDGKILVVTDFWQPFRIVKNDAKYGFAGIDIDILEGLEKYLNLTMEIQRHPFARQLEMIKDGTADLITGIALTEKRSEFILYVPTSYYTVGPVFITQKGRGHLVRTYDDLYQFQIGFSINSAYFEPFNSDAKLRKTGIPTEEQLIKMVALGRIDLIIGTDPNITYDIRGYGFKDKVEQTRYVPEQKTPIYFGLSKKLNKTDLQQKIDAYLRQIIENGELTRILDKYR